MTLLKSLRGAAPLFLFICAASAVARAEPLPSSDLSDASQQADEYFRKGKEAVVAGDLATAYAHYRRSWELKKSPDIVCNLGNVEVELSKWADAADHLSECIRHFPPTGEASRKAEAVKRYDEAKQHVEAITVRANIDNAEIRVDGRVVGKAPLAGPVHVEPGLRVIEASLTGYDGAREELTATPGATSTVELTLLDQGNPRAAGAGSSAHPKGWIIGTGIGASAALVGAGIMFALLSNSEAGERDELFGKLPAGDSWCSPGTPYASQCSAMEKARSNADTFKVLSIVGFGTAGAALGLTAAYAFWPRRDADKSPAMGATARALPVVGPNTAGFQVLGTFH